MTNVSVPDVTVVIPHYGDPAPTLALIDMLRGQVREIVVADDCSPVPFPDPQGVVVVRREVNGGFGSAVNSGAARATSALLLVLNSDLEVSDTFVEDLLAAARTWLPAVLTPRIIDKAGHPAVAGRYFPRTAHQAVEWLTPLARWRGTRSWRRAVGHDVRADGTHDQVVDWVTGAAMLMPLADFRAVGGFDERFFMNSEEVDLQRRLRSRGLPSVVLAHPSVIHEGGGSSDPARGRSWLMHSRLTYADKWGGRRRLQAALGAATALNLVVNGGRRLAGRDVAPLTTARSELALLRARDPRTSRAD